MIFTLLFSVVAMADDYRFHMMEGREVFLSESCLPKKATEYLKSKDRTVHVTQTHTLQGSEKFSGTELQSVKLYDSKEIAKACGLEGVQAFFEGKLYPVTNSMSFVLVEKESGDDCHYPVPRLVASIHGTKFVDAILLGPGFSVPPEKEQTAVRADFDRAAAASKKANPDSYPWGYGMAIFTNADEKGAVFVVADQTEMGTKRVLFRRKDGKWKELYDATYPPCGS